MNEITRSPAVIAGEIRSIKSQTSGILAAAFAVAGQGVIEIGRRLEEVKAMVPHGEWGDWLRDNVDYSVSTAENLMRCYREYGDEQIDLLTGKSPAEVFASLSYSQMVELFALPAPDRAAFVEEHGDDLGGMSVRELREQIRVMKEQAVKDEVILNAAIKLHKEAEERAALCDRKAGEAVEKADAAMKKLQQAMIETADYGKVTAERNELRARVGELEAKAAEVQEVTVIKNEPTEEQIAEIRRKALAEVEERHRGEMEQLEADLRTEAEAEKKKQADFFTASISDMNKKKAEAEEKAQKEIKRLKAAANVHANRITYALEAVNRAMSDIDTEIRAAESEAAGSGARLKAQVEAMIGKMLDGRGWQV